MLRGGELLSKSFIDFPMLAAIAELPCYRRLYKHARQIEASYIYLGVLWICPFLDIHISELRVELCETYGET